MKRSKPRRGKRKERGYTLLVLLFMMTLMTLAVMTAAPVIRTQRMREREAETVWRGKQYIRGIKLYYRKNGRFPNSLEDLTKSKTPGVRYMRQPYKDPMNPEDGTWRLIYVGPAGQLIGSVKQNANKLTLPQAGGAPGTPGIGGAQQKPAPSPGAGQNSGGGQGAGSQGMGDGQGGDQQDNTGDGSNPQPVSTQPTTIIGGNIVGVGSKINRRSFRIYDKGKKYREWEFIWDPSKDAVQVGQPGTQVGTPPGPGIQQQQPPKN